MNRWFKTVYLETRHDNRDDRKGKKRKSNSDYLQLGFCFGRDELEAKPLCVIRDEVLANSSIKPSLLPRNIETKHPAHEHKPSEYFKRKLADLKKKCSFSFFLSSNKASKMAFEVSFRVRYRIERFVQGHTIAEIALDHVRNTSPNVCFGKRQQRK